MNYPQKTKIHNNNSQIANNSFSITFQINNFKQENDPSKFNVSTFNDTLVSQHDRSTSCYTNLGQNSNVNSSYWNKHKSRKQTNNVIDTYGFTKDRNFPITKLSYTDNIHSKEFPSHLRNIFHKIHKRKKKKKNLNNLQYNLAKKFKHDTNNIPKHNTENNRIESPIHEFYGGTMSKGFYSKKNGKQKSFIKSNSLGCEITENSENMKTVTTLKEKKPKKMEQYKKIDFLEESGFKLEIKDDQSKKLNMVKFKDTRFTNLVELTGNGNESNPCDYEAMTNLKNKHKRFNSFVDVSRNKCKIMDYGISQSKKTKYEVDNNNSVDSVYSYGKEDKINDCDNTIINFNNDMCSRIQKNMNKTKRCIEDISATFQSRNMKNKEEIQGTVNTDYNFRKIKKKKRKKSKLIVSDKDIEKISVYCSNTNSSIRSDLYFTPKEKVKNENNSDSNTIKAFENVDKSKKKKRKHSNITQNLQYYEVSDETSNIEVHKNLKKKKKIDPTVDDSEIGIKMNKNDKKTIEEINEPDIIFVDAYNAPEIKKKKTKKVYGRNLDSILETGFEHSKTKEENLESTIRQHKKKIRLNDFKNQVNKVHACDEVIIASGSSSVTMENVDYIEKKKKNKKLLILNEETKKSIKVEDDTDIAKRIDDKHSTAQVYKEAKDLTDKKSDTFFIDECKTKNKKKNKKHDNSVLLHSSSTFEIDTVDSKRDIKPDITFINEYNCYKAKTKNKKHIRSDLLKAETLEHEDFKGVSKINYEIGRCITKTEVSVNNFVDHQNYRSHIVTTDANNEEKNVHNSDVKKYTREKINRNIKEMNITTLDATNNDVFVDDDESNSSEIISPKCKSEIVKVETNKYDIDVNKIEEKPCNKNVESDLIESSSDELNPECSKLIVTSSSNENIKDNKSKKKETAIRKIMGSLEDTRTTNQNDKSDILLEELSNEDLEEESEKFRNLCILFPFLIPPLHAIATTTTKMTAKQLEDIKNMNLTVKKGHYSKDEDERIMNNFKQFCKEHNMKMSPSVFVHFPRKTTIKIKVNFIRYLGHGLDNRPLNGIYCRFKHLLKKQHLKSGRFTPEEDRTILEFMETTTSSCPYKDLSELLNRTNNSIELRYELLTASNKIVNHWTPKNVDKLVKYLLSVTKCEKLKHLRDRKITAKEWKKISKKMDHISFRKLQTAWKITIYPRLFSKELNLRYMKRKIIKILSSRNETDWRTVDWKDIAKNFKGFTHHNIYMMFKKLVYYHVPEKLQSDLKECLEFLKKKFVTYDDIPATHKFKKFVVKDGQITYDNGK